MTITITVAGRIATATATTQVVAGNTYPVTLSLDSEWTGSLYLRVRFGGLYYDIPFASSAASVDVQMPVGYPEVGIGVYSEALEICTSEARVRLLRSILEAGEQVVEFDSDLYDQWAGEVTTLLTDDAFDAESTRPVQNAVITAWKDTVPLDANLVHKTGNETIAGTKTFNGSDVNIKGNNFGRLVLRSAKGMESVGHKGDLQITYNDNGTDRELAYYMAGNYDGYNDAGVAVWTPDRSRKYSLDSRAFNDHQLITIDSPYYPVDGSGNPQPLAANALMASGSIAVDPRIVHTTGTETVAGNKTITGYLTAHSSRPELAFWSTVENTTDAWKTYVRWADTKNGEASIYASLEGRANSDYTVQVLRLTKPDRSGAFVTEVKSLSDHMEFSYPAYYPVDGQSNPIPLGNNLIMTSGNISVDPRIVHTTGNEVVAGTKTFTNGIDAYPQNWHHTSKTGMTVGQYAVFAEITALNSVGRFVAVDFIQSSNTASCIGRMLFRCKIDASENPLAIWVYRKSKGSNDPLSAHSIVVLYKDGHAYLAWKREAPYGAVVARIAQDMGYGTVQSSTSSAVSFIPSADMTVLDNLDGYTVYEVTE